MRSLLVSALLFIVTCAVRPVGAAEVEFLPANTVLSADLPFSAAVRSGDTFYLSGQVGVVPGTFDLAPGGIEAETRQLMTNIAAVLSEHGLAMKHVVKCTVMLADMAEWERFNSVYTEFFTPPYPARSAFGVTALALGARAEVECIAVRRLR